MRPGLLSLVCVAAAAGCGARTALDVSSPTGEAGVAVPDAAPAPAITPDATSCPPAAPPPAGPCTSYSVTGAATLLTPNASLDDAVSLGTAVAAGCGVLIPWTTNSFVSPMSTDTQATWSTRAVAFDGTPLGPLQSYPFLQAPLNSGAGIEIAAASDGTVGALMTDMTGCYFVALGALGASLGSAVALTAPSCMSPAFTGGSFSFLSALAGGATPTTLVTLDAEGSMTSSTPLGDPAGRALWYRLVFGDGSFLNNTFVENGGNPAYTEWLQPFAAAGAALGPPVVTGAPVAPVVLATTPAGALSAWWAQGESISFTPVDKRGQPTGPTVTEPSGDATYDVSIWPMPSGDVLLTHLTNQNGAGEWLVTLQELAPDGTPRAPPWPVPPSAVSLSNEPVQPVVSADGTHIVLVYTDGANVWTLPLVCAR